MQLRLMAPAGVGWVDAQRLDGVDQLQHAFYLGPAGKPRQDVTARPNESNRRAALAERDRPDDVNDRDDRAVVVRRPAHEGLPGANERMRRRLSVHRYLCEINRQ